MKLLAPDQPLKVISLIKTDQKSNPDILSLRL